MAKYRLLRERLTAQLPAALFDTPQAATDAQLALAHTQEYIARVESGALSARELRVIGFPWSAAMVERSRRSSGATIAAARHALMARSCGINLAGGTHHAFADRGEGFCVFNDSAVAARVAQHEFGIARVLIVDLDVHQGNGTASILRDDPSVYTFSMHGARNYPIRKEASDLDVELADGTDDDEYLHALGLHLSRLLREVDPQLIVYLAGADPYKDDRFGRLSLTKEGLRSRDEFVLRHAHDRAIPITVSMAGGYAEDVNDIVDIHFATVMTAVTTFARGASI